MQRAAIGQKAARGPVIIWIAAAPGRPKAQE
jgi:hypothetical protein